MTHKLSWDQIALGSVTKGIFGVTLLWGWQWVEIGGQRRQESQAFVLLVQPWWAVILAGSQIRALPAAPHPNDGSEFRGRGTRGGRLGRGYRSRRGVQKGKVG